MAATKLRLLHTKLWKDLNIFKPVNVQKNFYCTDKTDKSKEENVEKKPFDFAAFFEQQSQLKQQLTDPESGDSKPSSETFAGLLRNSKFVDLGDPEGKLVIGTIYHTVENDLYIDFGWKFPTVCQRPFKNGELYQRGVKVKLLVKDLELSARFLGDTTDVTLLEADCVLLGLARK